MIAGASPGPRPPPAIAPRAAAALVAACVLVLPFGRVVEVPVALMAVAGLYVIARRRRALFDSAAIRLFSLVFLAAWLPMLVSLADAVNVERTSGVVLGHLRFFLGGLLIVHCLARDEEHAWLLRVCAWLLAIWVVDALVQITAGRDLLGYGPSAGRINALFGNRNPTFSLTLAVLCPLLWEHARRQWPRWITPLVVLATVVVVLVAQTRSAWISIAVILFAYALLLAPRRRLGLACVLTTVALIVAGTALYRFSERFADRVDQTTAALTGGSTAAPEAIGHRIWIWKGALAMIEGHPINGVGARGFRYAFAEYADPEDPFVHRDEPIMPTHSHQLWLEILAETGVIGALGLLVLLALLVRAARRAPPAARRVMLPYGLGLLAAYFPLNTHMAIHSSFWAQILWWLTALYCAASAIGGEPPAAGEG